jgi:hypothetical protein
MALDKVPEKLNPVVTKAIESLLEPMSNPVTHGDFNRRMFLEAVVVKGGVGASIDKEDIVRHAALTEREFVKLKDTLMAEGILKETKTQFDTVLYSLCLE